MLSLSFTYHERVTVLLIKLSINRCLGNGNIIELVITTYYFDEWHIYRTTNVDSRRVLFPSQIHVCYQSCRGEPKIPV